MPKSKIIQYEHHGIEVAVRENLKGKHREHCLCFSCSKFNKDNPKTKCKIADSLYHFDMIHGLTTPVWECPEFKESNN